MRQDDNFNSGSQYLNAERLQHLPRAEYNFIISMEKAPIGIAIADATEDDFPLVYVNETFREMTGYSFEEIIGHNCRFLQAGDRDQRDIPDISRTLANGKTGLFLLRNYRKDGALFWNQLYLSPVYDENDNLIYYMSVQNDITRQIMSEREAYVRSRLQSALSRLSFMALNNTNFGDSLHYVGKIINEALEGDFCTILAYKPENRQLEIYDVIGLHDYKSQYFQMLLSIDDNHFLAQSMHSDTPIISQQITQDIGVAGHEPQIDFVREYNVSASISCRIKLGNQLFGAIAVHRIREKEFLQIDAEFLQTFINFFDQICLMQPA